MESHSFLGEDLYTETWEDIQEEKNPKKKTYKSLITFFSTIISIFLSFYTIRSTSSKKYRCYSSFIYLFESVIFFIFSFLHYLVNYQTYISFLSQLFFFLFIFTLFFSLIT